MENKTKNDYLNEGKKEAAGSDTVERRVIRQLLEEEIKSLDKSADRYAKREQYEAAAHDHIRREGISWALFVLSPRDLAYNSQAQQPIETK